MLVAFLAALLVTGQWNGTMVRDGDRLNVRFEISNTSPQRATTTAFDGNAHVDAITGSFSENGRTGTFVLHRTTGAADSPYDKRDVSFRNANVTLAGTVYEPRSPGLHPAIIFVHGSGDEGRWASAYLADFAARAGIVALAYDKRGVGESTGN